MEPNARIDAWQPPSNRPWRLDPARYVPSHISAGEPFDQRAVSREQQIHEQYSRSHMRNNTYSTSALENAHDGSASGAVWPPAENGRAASAAAGKAGAPPLPGQPKPPAAGVVDNDDLDDFTESVIDVEYKARCPYGESLLMRGEALPLPNRHDIPSCRPCAASLAPVTLCTLCCTVRLRAMQVASIRLRCKSRRRSLLNRCRR